MEQNKPLQQWHPKLTSLSLQKSKESVISGPEDCVGGPAQGVGAVFTENNPKLDVLFPVWAAGGQQERQQQNEQVQGQDGGISVSKYYSSPPAVE